MFELSKLLAFLEDLARKAHLKETPTCNLVGCKKGHNQTTRLAYTQKLLEALPIKLCTSRQDKQS